MSRLSISGTVLYSDATPAPGADVTITEVDGLPAGVNDKILTRQTDPEGRFSGLSAEWNDREGRVLGLDTSTSCS